MGPNGKEQYRQQKTKKQNSVICNLMISSNYLFGAGGGEGGGAWRFFVWGVTRFSRGTWGGGKCRCQQSTKEGL